MSDYTTCKLWCSMNTMGFFSFPPFRAQTNIYTSEQTDREVSGTSHLFSKYTAYWISESMQQLLQDLVQFSLTLSWSKQGSQ